MVINITICNFVFYLWCTRFCDMSIVFFMYSIFLHQYYWPCLEAVEISKIIKSTIFNFHVKSTLSGLMISQYLDVIFQLSCNVILTTIMLLDIEMSLIIWQHIIIGKLHLTGKTFSVHFPTYFNTLSSYKADWISCKKLLQFVYPLY